jgi:polyphenol oxidase
MDATTSVSAPDRIEPAMPSSGAIKRQIRAVDRSLQRAGIGPARRPSRPNRPKKRAQPVPEESIHRQKQKRVAKSRVEVIRVPQWKAWPWLVHGFSTRTGGVTTAYRPAQRAGELNLGFTASDTRENVEENRRRFLQALGATGMKLITLRQIHSASVLRVGSRDRGEPKRGESMDAESPCKGDGLMTAEPGILLAIQTADCIPVLVADVKKKVVAAFHAGWRGTVRRIVENGVGKMRAAFGCQPENLVAAIGPGIAACCYAVGDEVRSEFASQFRYADALFHEVANSDPVKTKYPMLFLNQRAPGHGSVGPALHLDLMEANRRQLLDAGLGARAIAVVGDCTQCQNNRYFSYRAEQGFTGRLLSAIGVRG